MPHSHSNGENVVVVAAQQSGLTIIPSPSPLTSLNYFDGKFLRAADLDTEKRYMRMLVELSNRGGGSGVVHGLDTTLAAGDAIGLGPGMAIDPAGRVLLLPTATQVRIDELLDATRRRSGSTGASQHHVKALGASLKPAVSAVGATAGSPVGADFEDCEDIVETPPSGIAHANDLYLISIAHAEALCGHEDVFGRLCDDSCITRSDRPFRVEGIVVRATPLPLRTQLIDTGAIAIDRRHLRSRVASAYFADDALRVGSLISRAGLASDAWCLGARLEGGADVPLAILARSGGTTLFLDAWTARRERMEAPARRYWAQRMAMRPWETYLAQILQFQCQLHDLFGGQAEPGGDDDPCRPQHAVLDEAAKVLEDVESHYTQLLGATLSAATPTMDAAGATIEVGKLPGGLARIAMLRGRIRTALEGAYNAPTNRVLIQGGILEAPPAGYLPVVPGSGITVNEQVRRLMGEGVDLRFCVVRADFVPHALEGAQHMERISLVAGLDHPEARPRVDILVPDGEIEKVKVTPTGMGFATTVRLHLGAPDRAIAAADSDDARLMMRSRLTPVPSSALEIQGAGRGEILPNGRMAFHMAGATEARRSVGAAEFIHAIMGRSVDNRTATEVLAETPTISEAEHAADVARPMLAGRLRTLAGSAADHLRSVRIAETTLSDAAPEPIGAFSAALAAGERRVVALWTSMAIDGDLRSVAPGSTVPVRGDFALVTPSRLGSTQRLTVRGELRVDEAIDTANGRKIVGQASLVGTHRDIREGALQPAETTTEDFRVAIELDLRAGALQSLTIRLLQDRSRIDVAATWTFGPMSVNVRIGRGSGDSRHEIVDADALESATALLPGSVPHTLAMSAIELVAASFQDPGFRDAAIRALFATPEQPQQDLVVRATRDWVLFHRRRDITCDVETEAPALAPPRRYALFQRSVKDRREAERIRAALLSQDADQIQRAGLRQVDVVDFAGGQAALATPADSVRADWTASGPGDRILYSYIASAGPGDGDLLARARLGRLLDALVVVTPLDAAAAVDAVAGVPTPLAIAGLDGAIVELTVAVATTCVRVVRLDHKGEAEPPRVSVANGVALVEVGQSSQISELGQLTFTEGQSDPAAGADGVRDAWQQFGAGPSDHIVVVSGRGDDSAGPPSLRSQRAEAIAELLPVKPRKIQLVEVEESLKECPTTVVVIARPPAMTVDCVRVHFVGDAGFEKVQAARSMAELEAALADLSRHAGDAEFEPEVPAFMKAPADIRAAWQASGAQHIEITHVFSQKGDPRAGTAVLREERVKAIFEATGMPGSGINDNVFGDAVSGPCAVIAVMFVPNVVATDCHTVWLVRDPDVFERLLGQGSLAGVEDLLLHASVQAAIHIGEARFLAETADFQDDPSSLRQRFEDESGGVPTRAAVCARTDAAGGQMALQEKRGFAIMAALGVGEDVQALEFEDAPTDGCQALTALFHQP